RASSSFSSVSPAWARRISPMGRPTIHTSASTAGTEGMSVTVTARTGRCGCEGPSLIAIPVAAHVHRLRRVAPRGGGRRIGLDDHRVRSGDIVALVLPVAPLTVCVGGHVAVAARADLARADDAATWLAGSTVLELLGLLGDGARHPRQRSHLPAEVERDLIAGDLARSEEHTSELQPRENLVCRLQLL